MDLSERLIAAFADAIGPARYQLWFPPNARLEWHNRTLTVTCRNDHFRDWARDQFGPELERVARELVEGAVVRYIVSTDSFADRERPEPVPRQATNLFGESLPPPKPKSGRRWKQLADFVVGVNNRVAVAAIEAVLDEPGLGPNPLVLFGPPGTGKTHLLEAVVAGLATASPKPLFLPAEEFTHRFVQASRTGRMQAFRKLTRGAGALIVDDLHFLATKRGTQEELLHAIDSQLAEGRPVIASLDTHPRLADELLPELVDRLLGGAAWSLLPPDAEARLAILRRKALPPLPEDVLGYLARYLSGNVRELEGALHTLRHYAKVTQTAITLPVAQDILGDLLRQTRRDITLTEIDAATCKIFKLSSGALQSKARTPAITQPRMLAVYLARKHTGATYGEIARHFGVRQHSTALAGEKKVRSALKESESGVIAELLSRIERELMK